jgi:hypothetical protein
MLCAVGLLLLFGHMSSASAIADWYASMSAILVLSVEGPVREVHGLFFRIFLFCIFCHLFFPLPFLSFCCKFFEKRAISYLYSDQQIAHAKSLARDWHDTG